jgi:protein gp37
MNKTNIEWVKNPDDTQGYTWNPITGCLNHTNGLCNGGGFPCYAYKLANGRLKQRYLANGHITPYMTPGNNFNDPFYPRLWSKRMLEQFGDYAEPKGIFVCDMGELFGDWIPNEWAARLFEKISKPWYQEHRFYLLTKQPQNLPKWSPFPDNCWVGVTVTNADMLFDALNYLDDIQCKVRYVSIEPMLGNCHLVDLAAHLGGTLDWVIIGAQTKPYKPPKIEWVEEIVEAADKAGIPVFLKDNLAPLLINEKGMGNVSPGTLIERVIETGNYKLRQEMPR